MNLKFETRYSIILNKTSVMDRIKTSLPLNNYKIIGLTESSILFNDDINAFKVVSNFKYYSTVNDGELNVVEKGDQSDIHLTYHVGVDFELVELLMLMVASILITPFALILILVISLNFAFKIININKNFIKTQLG